MSLLTDKANELATLAKQIADQQAQLDTSHDKLKQVVQDYGALLNKVTQPSNDVTVNRPIVTMQGE